MTRSELAQRISRHIPSGAVEQVVSWIAAHQILLIISRKRKSLLGSYHAPTAKRPQHCIRINGDLNCYAFLLTFTHELAHLVTYVRYGCSVAPHGEEWKAAFRELMAGFLQKEIFPPQLAEIITNYLKDPQASSTRNHALYKALNSYNKQRGEYLENVPMGGVFNLADGRRFRKLAMLRTYCRCEEINTGVQYRIHRLMEVELS
ncbi:SprT-like domain-containing protein [Rhodoflexus sp.]